MEKSIEKSSETHTSERFPVGWWSQATVLSDAAPEPEVQLLTRAPEAVTGHCEEVEARVFPAFPLWDGL